MDMCWNGQPIKCSHLFLWRLAIIMANLEEGKGVGFNFPALMLQGPIQVKDSTSMVASIWNFSPTFIGYQPGYISIEPQDVNFSKTYPLPHTLLKYCAHTRPHLISTFAPICSFVRPHTPQPPKTIPTHLHTTWTICRLVPYPRP
jgi:hypothetical protein